MKNRIKKSIVEANIVVNIDSLDKVMPKLGKDDTIKLVDEASTDNGSGYKTIPLKKVYAIAKKAGEIVSDAEDEILDLYMVYSDTDSVPTVKVKEILNSLL